MNRAIFSKTTLMLTVLACVLMSHSAWAQTDSIKYSDTEIFMSTPSGTLFGSMMLPKNAHGKIPVVLIIAGSGPTDRNCNNPMMTCDAYKKIAQTLAENNIASVRYDKRGIAASKAAGKSEKDMRFEDYVKDAIDWVNWIKAKNEFSEIIIAGHSEGSLIGMLASTKDVSKFISIAGVAQSADKVLKEQLSNMPQPLQSQSFSIIDSLVMGKEVKQFPSSLASLFRASVQPYLISWFRQDPMKAMARLNIPILILQGTEDMQVKQEEGKMLATANKNAKLVLVEGMNHVLRVILNGRDDNMASYDDPSRPIALLLQQSMVQFIQTK